MKKASLIIILVMILMGTATGQTAGHDYPEYQAIKQRLATGWNTWDTRSVLSQVLMPEGFAINLVFKQHYLFWDRYLDGALIGKWGEDAEQIRPGPHAWDGSYTQFEVRWEQLHATVETATDGDDLVILVTPLAEAKYPVKMIIESGMLWNRPGTLSRDGDKLVAELSDRTISVFCTGKPVDDDPYIPTRTPFLAFNMNEEIGVSTGVARTVEDIKTIIEKRRTELQEKAVAYGDLSEAYIAIQAGIAWNTIYEPKHDRVVSTVGRLWNAEYGGYCLFGWDNFFLAYMTSLDNRDLAFANVIEHLRGKTEEGFICNNNQGNGMKSWDRSQPPVGGIMVKEIYKRYPEKWFLEATFDDLLGWNKWWFKRRMNEGLLGYGSHPAKDPLKENVLQTKVAAGYESGMDDSPMYVGVPFNKEKATMELQDIGLNSLVIADCKALADMATVLDRDQDKNELLERANMLGERMEQLWDDEIGFYLNRRTDTGELSKRLSPTLFYPLLANLPDKDRAQRMIDEHFFNPDEFYGEWMLPSTARNDSLFERQRYWKGAIWPPLNFLTYLSLRHYDMPRARKELAEKSLRLLVTEWKRKGYVSENYSSITGTGDDSRLSSDKFHSWGALFGIISFIESGTMPPPEDDIAP